MYSWMQKLHVKNLTDAESSDSHEKNEKAQKTKKKGKIFHPGWIIVASEEKKKFGVIIQD